MFSVYTQVPCDLGLPEKDIWVRSKITPGFCADLQGPGEALKGMKQMGLSGEKPLDEAKTKAPSSDYHKNEPPVAARQAEVARDYLKRAAGIGELNGHSPGSDGHMVTALKRHSGCRVLVFVMGAFAEMPGEVVYALQRLHAANFRGVAAVINSRPVIRTGPGAPPGFGLQPLGRPALSPPSALEALGASRARLLVPQRKITTISQRRASHPARKGLVCCCPIA